MRNDARRSHVEDAWAKAHRPLRLRAKTLDTAIHEWYKELEGPVARLSGQVNRRLTEYALNRATASHESILAGEPASGALVDAFSHRFSLFNDAGVTTPDALATAYDSSYYELQLVRAVESILSPLRGGRTDIRRELAETRELNLTEVTVVEPK